MNKLQAIVAAGLLALVAGCAAPGGTAGGSASGAAGGTGGVTVFGTMDAGVSGYRNR